MHISATATMLQESALKGFLGNSLIAEELSRSQR
jgi:hypothetical protein